MSNSNKIEQKKSNLTVINEAISLQEELSKIHSRIREIEKTFGIDALVFDSSTGPQVFTIENSHSYRLLIESLNDGAAVFSEDGTVSYCNAKLALLLGVSAQNVAGTSIENWIDPSELISFRRQLKSASDQSSARVQLCLKRSDGRLVQVLLSLRFLVQGGDQSVCLVATDLTELKLQEYRYKQIIETIQEGIWNTNSSGVTIFVNRVMAAMLGYEASEMIGRPSTNFFYEEDLPQVKKIVELRNQGRTYRGELRLRSKSGQDVWTNVATGPMLDSAGKITGGLGLFIDDTGRRRADFQLGQIGKLEAMGRLAGGIAHDFNNILGVIGMACETVIDSLGPGHNLAGVLDTIMKANARGAGLTRQLLTFSRNQVGIKTVIDVNVSVHSLYLMLKRILGQNIEFDCQLTKNRLDIKIDPSQLDQVIMNLVVNARDAIEGEGKIQVRTSEMSLSPGNLFAWPGLRPGEYVCLEVEDSGQGIPAEILPKIFDPFFTTKEPGKGTGLGLATTYGIVKEQGGMIAVNSRVGRTCFTVLIPKSYEIQDQKQDIQKLIASRTFEQGMRVLLVEDEPALLKMISSMLSNLGFEVLEAANGEEAIKVYQSSIGKLDLLITDLVMPLKGGLRLYTELLQKEPDLEVIFISGNVSTNANLVLIPKPDRLLSKPFGQSELLQMISGIFGDMKSDQGALR